MKRSSAAVIDDLLKRYPALASCEADIRAAGETLIGAFRSGGKLLVCGNGGSCADGQHLVGELMKAFFLPRKLNAEESGLLTALDPEYGGYMAEKLQCAQPAISLSGETALMTAYINDVAADMVYAQQVWGYGRKGDVLLALSTSGRSKNVVLACTAARARGLKVIGMTGSQGRAVGERSDVLIAVPAQEAYLVQEYHLPVWHALCLMLEEEFFGTDTSR